MSAISCEVKEAMKEESGIEVKVDEAPEQHGHLLGAEWHGAEEEKRTVMESHEGLELGMDAS